MFYLQSQPRGTLRFCDLILSHCTVVIGQSRDIDYISKKVKG